MAAAGLEAGAVAIPAAAGTAAAQPASNNGQHNLKLNKFLFIVLLRALELGLPTLTRNTRAIYHFGTPTDNGGVKKNGFIVLFDYQELPILFRFV